MLSVIVLFNSEIDMQIIDAQAGFYLCGEGGTGRKLPPKSIQLLPQTKSSKRKREREEVGNITYYLGAMIIHVNNIPLN